MAKTIWKWPLLISDEQWINMPPNAEVIHVGLDPLGAPSIWAIVTPEDAGSAVRKVRVHGTGHPLPSTEGYVGSFTQGSFVWHVFA